LIPVELRELRRDELHYAAGVTARGMRDNPMCIGVLGDDPRHRLRMLNRSFLADLDSKKQAPLVAVRGNHVVGVAGIAPPGTCRMSFVDTLKLFPRVRPTRLGDVLRTFRWMHEWEIRDISEPHCHLGPVAVEPGLQGMGVGSQLLQQFTERMDAERQVSYLETDKPTNVLFYERFGFETIDEAEVLGAHNWFMRREPR
jgi:ribosomal protein S18 acetylase RimI-like enzyme